jgi:hypothetical protein
MNFITESSARRIGPMLAGLLLAVCCGSAMAQVARVVIVNGGLLDAAGLAIVDQLNCGQPLENGNYWIDFDNGRWGYAGQADSYPLPDCSAGLGGPYESPAQEPGEDDDCASKYPVYEDRMCYCYHVCM